MTGYQYIKVLLTVLLIISRVVLFSQLNHDDSINQTITHLDSIDYFDWLDENVKMHNIKGRIMPDLTVRDPKGNLFSQDSLRSKITFINFWFEACAPCVAEFSALEKFYINNKSKENFQFISITFESDSAIERIRKKYNLTYPIYRFQLDSARKMQFNLGFGYPTNLIVNKYLEIVHFLVGGPIDPKRADMELNHFVQGELNRQLLKTGD